MTQNVRYCAGCGRASCGTCGRRVRGPNPAADFGLMMWLVLIVLGCIGGAISAIPAGAGIPMLVGLGVLALVIVLVVLANKNEKKRPRPKTGVPLTPPPTTGPWPDLRESDVFEGKR